MILALLRGRSRNCSLSQQQKHMLKFSRQEGFSVDTTEIDNSAANTSLENREEFLTIIRSLKKGDTFDR